MLHKICYFNGAEPPKHFYTHEIATALAKDGIILVDAETFERVRTSLENLQGAHPDHPPVEGGYRGEE